LEDIMRIVARIAAATLLMGLLVVSSCGKKGGGNPVAPPGGGTLELNSLNIGPGGNFQHTFATAGTYPYHCSIHSAMTGTITVNPTGAMAGAVSIVSSNAAGFSPASVTIGVGGEVTWTNNDSNTHTVTSN